MPSGLRDCISKCSERLECHCTHSSLLQRQARGGQNASNDIRLHGLYTILYYTILYYTILYYTILYSTLLYSTLLYSTLRYDTILYRTDRDPATASPQYNKEPSAPQIPKEILWSASMGSSSGILQNPLQHFYKPPPKQGPIVPKFRALVRSPLKKIRTPLQPPTRQGPIQEIPLPRCQGDLPAEPSAPRPWQPKDRQFHVEALWVCCNVRYRLVWRGLMIRSFWKITHSPGIVFGGPNNPKLWDF